MLNSFLSVVWNVDPTLVSIGSFEIRYYGLCWAIGIGIGMWMFVRFARREGLPDKVAESINLWSALGIIIGARLGHCLFYDPGYYLTHPVEIITGIRDGGLASHGAALGLLAALWFVSRKQRIPYIWPLDRIMIPITVGGAIVRLGNLMNSEIYGVETDLPWGFIFVRAGETLPKHPTQIYEALAYLITFGVLMWLYYRKDIGRRRPGVLFGVGLIGVFLSRFFIEFVKNPQETFEESMRLDMGQWLSIPFIVIGIGVIVWAYRRPAKTVPEQVSTPVKKSVNSKNTAGKAGKKKAGYKKKK